MAKRGRLRAIDQGTRYDIVGNIRRLERGVRSGAYGDVRDVVVAVRAAENDGRCETQVFHFGTGGIPQVHHILETAKHRTISRC